MNKTQRLSKSGIEYLDYSWGIWSGCQNIQRGICSINSCWAKGIATRFKSLYPNGFEPTFYPLALDSPRYLKKPSIISVGWVGEIIGYSSPAVRIAICDAIKHCPQHTFMFLTKNPERLKEWDFPDNCWVGVTATDYKMFSYGLEALANIQATIKYISIEPMLDRMNIPLLDEVFKNCTISWVLIGAQTKPTIMPKIEWVQEIVQACRTANIPIFLKNNLEPILEGRKLIQEMPKR